MIFEYRGGRYPDFIRRGNACQFIQPAALKFCQGRGLDVGAGPWPLPGATPIDLQNGGDALKLPEGPFDFIFSSHCLEHLADPVAALEHWKTRLRPGGVLFLYLPHPDMEYWLPQNNRKHLHAWQPREIERLIRDLGLVNTLRSERDLAWSFAVVGFMPGEGKSADAGVEIIPQAAPQAPDAAFRWLIGDSSAHIHADPQFSAIFKKFGADAFRRSSAVEPEFEAIIKKGQFRGQRCVEIGSYNGITALVLARHFDEVVSIDVFPHTIKHTLAEFCGVKNIRFVDVKDNAEKAAVINGLDQFDGAYVDGDHRDVETDFALVKRSRHVLFHEYWEQQKPVWNLVNTLKSTAVVEVFGKFALWTPLRRG